ncbi:hypothetical protein AGOR_G00127680 [Albula goreensis]|uniref:Uncharacterized protein n=1 Tax=Albula goreensis TaxID=1534307 RepID=A0A8T3DE90_9TELE|nr:hypothetical protein AGOR_G00127680 [Albula goreensis]
MKSTAKSNTLRSRTASSGRSKAKSRGRKKKVKATVTPTEIEPWLEKLHLSDNAIDTFGPGNAPGVLSFAHRIYSLIKFSTHLTELDLSDNHIGDQAGKVLLEALQERREAEMAALKIKVTTQMSADTFAAILKNSKGLKSVKKRKKAKK